MSFDKRSDCLCPKLVLRERFAYNQLQEEARLKTCRLCDRPLFETPALSLVRVPIGAQAFLDDPAAGAHGKTIDLRLLECGACGLLQLDNEPVSYFRDVITASSFSPGIVAARREQFRAWIDTHGLAGRRVIEIGCGRGHLLDVLGELGVEPWGLEHGEAAVDAAKASGRRVVRGYPTEMKTELPRFDGFVCFNFLEHATRPNAFLAGIHALLEDGAVGIVEVPNFGQDIVIERHYDLIIDHLSYFTKETLSRALEWNGFDVLELGTCFEDDSVRAVVRKRAPSNYEHWKSSNPVLQRMNELLTEPRYGRVAVWGASHEALTLLSMTGSVPVCIFDSAPFKQHKYEPSRGIKVLPPSELSASKIDTVIVLAAIYSAEVVDTLVHQLGFKGNILRVISGRLEQVQEGPAR